MGLQCHLMIISVAWVVPWSLQVRGTLCSRPEGLRLFSMKPVLLLGACSSQEA